MGTRINNNSDFAWSRQVFPQMYFGVKLPTIDRDVCSN